MSAKLQKDMEQMRARWEAMKHALEEFRGVIAKLRAQVRRLGGEPEA